MQTVPVCIGEAEAGDLKDVAKLFQREAEFHEALAGYYEIEAEYDWEAFLAATLVRKNRRIFVAKQGDRLIGFVFVRLGGRPAPRRAAVSWKRPLVAGVALLRRILRRGRKPGPPFPPLKPVTWGVIEDCWVVENVRRQGVGQALVAAAMGWVRQQGIQRIEAGILAQNSPSVKMFEKLGFRTFRLLLSAEHDERANG